MRGEGLSSDCSRPRPCSGKKTLRASKMKGNTDNVVVIDIDSDGYDGVIIFDNPKKQKKASDIPKPFQQKVRPSHVLREGNRVSFEGTISIDDGDDGDDDDDDDDSNLNFRSHKVDNGVSGKGNQNGGVDGMPSSSTFGNTQKFTVDSDDDCKFIGARRSTHNLSKCSRPHTDESSSRNRYGYYSDSESDSSESDSSDCEILDGSNGNPREEWEKACKRRKSNVGNDESGTHDTNTFYNYSTDTCQNVNLGNSSRKTSDVPVFSESVSTRSAKSSPSGFSDGGDEFIGVAACNINIGNPSAAESSQKADHESVPGCSKSTLGKNPTSVNSTDDPFVRETFMEDHSFGHEKYQTSNFNTASFQQHSHRRCDGPSLSSNQDSADSLSDHKRSTSLDEEHGSEREHTSAFSAPGFCEPDQDSQRFQDKDPSSCEDGVPQTVDNLNKPDVHQNQESQYKDKDPSSCEVEVPQNVDNPNKPYVQKTQESQYKDACNGTASKGREEPAVVENYAQPFGDISGKSGDQDMEIPNAGEISNDDQLHTTQNKPETSGSGEGEKPFAEPVSEFQQCGESNPLFSSPVDDCLSQGNIINEREKLKETEEYKRAIEEEWEARQHQLRIQAEEAQRLRKRKKAEALRILDMERRQKERLEEVRKRQKKDEENLNTKERLRVEVRKELSLLERRCSNLASVLRSLGIDVGGGFCPPTSHEVHAAYKRALLKFHPDRASRTDIRQQVEAEEKFKLISRMKEKFLPASLC